MRKLIVSIVLGFIVVAQGVAGSAERLTKRIPANAMAVVYYGGGSQKTHVSLISELLKASGHPLLVEGGDGLQKLNIYDLMAVKVDSLMGNIIFVMMPDNQGFVLMDTRSSEEDFVKMFTDKLSGVLLSQTERDGFNTYAFEVKEVLNLPSSPLGSIPSVFAVSFPEKGVVVIEAGSEDGPVWAGKLKSGFGDSANQRCSFIGRNDVIFGVNVQLSGDGKDSMISGLTGGMLPLDACSILLSTRRVGDDVELKLAMKVGVKDEEMLEGLYVGVNGGAIGLLAKADLMSLLPILPRFFSVNKNDKTREISAAITLNKGVLKDIVSAEGFDVAIDKLTQLIKMNASMNKMSVEITDED